MSKTVKKNPSELRFDPVSKDWVVIATGRARRPEEFRKREARAAACPFDDLEKGAWTAIALPNKYPAFAVKKSFETRLVGP